LSSTSLVHPAPHSFPTRRSSDLPEKKAWPPRLLIIALLTVLSLAGAVVKIVGSARWEHVDPQDPRKVFAESVWKTTSNRGRVLLDRKSTRLNSSHQIISYAVFCL